MWLYAGVRNGKMAKYGTYLHWRPSLRLPANTRPCRSMTVVLTTATVDRPWAASPSNLMDYWLPSQRVHECCVRTRIRRLRQFLWFRASKTFKTSNEQWTTRPLSWWRDRCSTELWWSNCPRVRTANAWRIGMEARTGGWDCNAACDLHRPSCVLVGRRTSIHRDILVLLNEDLLDQNVGDWGTDF